jgi:hypothetical protein
LNLFFHKEFSNIHGKRKKEKEMEKDRKVGFGERKLRN